MGFAQLPEPEPGAEVLRFTSAELLPMVYEELRRLAAARLARDAKGSAAMQPTSLVHHAYLRLIESAAEAERAWDGRGHFFGAAALAMRRILVDRARKRGQIKRGGKWRRVSDPELLACADDAEDPVDLVALDAALDQLRAYSEDLYQIVMLRYFGGVSLDQTAEVLGVSAKTIRRRWMVARLWLLDRIDGAASRDPEPHRPPHHDPS